MFGRVGGLVCIVVVLAAGVASAASADLMPNGSFENGLTGWTAFGGSAATAGDGAVGPGAAKVTGSTTRYGMYTDAWPVSSGTAGDVYASTAWLRSDSSGVSGCLRVREWDSTGSTIVNYAESCLTLTTRWQQLSVSYTLKTTGDKLEAYFFANGTSGTSFEADAVTLVDNGPATPPPPAPAPDTTITAGPASSTTDTTASFSFTSPTSGATFQCALDGAAFAACASPKAYSGLAVGSHTFQVRAVDGSGTVDPTPASQTWTVQAPAPPPPSTSGDLMQNGSFEGSLSGWTAFGGSAALATDGKVGTNAAKISGTTSRFGIYTDYWPVTNATAGHVLASTAWFRSDAPGTSVCLRVREWDKTGSTVVDYRETCQTPTATWAQVSVSYTVRTSGDLVEAYVFQNGFAGTSFEVDAVTLVDTTGAPPAPDPVLLAAGDIASCTETWDSATAALLQQWPNATVATLGDNAYENGSASDYANCYDPTWGAAKTRTHPSAGNHEYWTTGAAGYFGYFGAAAGTKGQGWYSYDVGSWHVIVLNSNCTEVTGGCAVGGAQEQWLKADLQAHPNQCTLAYWHHPLYTSGSVGNDPDVRPFWDDLYAAGADVVLNGHAHVYERFAPIKPDGTLDTARGIRAFTVGTGGEDMHGFGTRAPNSEVVDDTTYGVIKLTLHAGSYDWQYVPAAGQSSTFTDSGTGSCH